jgi:hypothetical protein
MITRRNFLRNSALGIAATAIPSTVSSVPLTNSTGINEVDKLKAGVAREIITPKLGGKLMGYAAGKPSSSVHDELTVTALAIENGKIRVLLMSVSVCLISNVLAKKLREICGEAAGIPAENVIIGASHTHSGPTLTDDYLNEIFIPKFIAAAKSSIKDMKPVTIGVAKTESLVGISRRKLLPDDSVILSQNPWGIYDPEMTVVSFKGEDGKSLANIVHCSAHCTAAGISSEITRDWAGVMTDRLDRESGAITLFFQGLQGDVGPRLSNGEDKGDINYVLEVGSRAGFDAVRAYKDIRVYRDEPMSIVTGDIKIPYIPFLPLEEARRELAKLEETPNAPFAETAMNMLKRNIEALEKGEKEETHFTYLQTLIKIGSIVFIPVPFEASSEISLRLRAYSKYGHTLALGCTNGSNTYLVTKDQISRGGYEVERFKWATVRQYVDNADMHLINENIKLMEKL